jgi:DNA-binding transcriptional MerR regulator
LKSIIENGREYEEPEKEENKHGEFLMNMLRDMLLAPGRALTEDMERMKERRERIDPEGVIEEEAKAFTLYQARAEGQRVVDEYDMERQERIHRLRLMELEIKEKEAQIEMLSNPSPAEALETSRSIEEIKKLRAETGLLRMKSAKEAQDLRLKRHTIDDEIRASSGTIGGPIRRK